MSMLKEFKEFAIKGNVLDLAVAVVIGAAFAKILNSFVEDILMPPIGLLLGDHDITSYFVTLSPGRYETLAQAKAAGAATLNYGVFLSTVINFVIIALAIFLVIRKINAMSRKPAEEVTPAMRDCPQCLSPVPINAVRCRFCTQAMTTDPAAVRYPPAQPA